MHVVVLEEPPRKCWTCGAKPHKRRVRMKDDTLRSQLVCPRCRVTGPIRKSGPGAVKGWNVVASSETEFGHAD